MTVSSFAEGTFVWTNFPFGPPDRPNVPGPVRHIAYVLASSNDGSSVQLLLAYTSSGRWRGAAPRPPIGAIGFDEAAALALNQWPVHIDLRCLARVPLTVAWFPDLALPRRGVVAVAATRARDRILKAAELLASRSPRLIEIRGISASNLAHATGAPYVQLSRCQATNDLFLRHDLRPERPSQKYAAHSHDT